ncbi:GD15687 [Drosophila simulans]|uniref:GD15687 n=1 Tax=Drosophila simulans TaxID=7240 RepID=B4R6F0_DROSI|nr:GD15687 [Drosophila simulans]
MAIETNSKQLEENTKQTARNMALVKKVFLEGKAKNARVVEAFPVSSDEDLADLELKISESQESKKRYIKAVTNILKGNILSKAIKSVAEEQLLCAYNIGGRNGKKALKSFPQFFSVLIECIGSLVGRQDAEKALSHALTCNVSLNE